MRNASSIALAVLVLQNTSLVLLMRHSLTAHEDATPYLTSTAVTMMEVSNVKQATEQNKPFMACHVLATHFHFRLFCLHSASKFPTWECCCVRKCTVVAEQRGSGISSTVEILEFQSFGFLVLLYARTQDRPTWAVNAFEIVLYLLPC